MRKAALFLIVAAACSPKADVPASDTSGTVSAASNTDSSDRASIEAIRSGWHAAADKKDAATIAGLFSDDGVLQLAGAPAARGHDELVKGLTQGLAVVSNLKVNSEKLHVSGDLAVDEGTYSEHVAAPGAKAMDINGRYIVVLKKINGTWKIVNQMGWVPPAAP